MINIFINMVDSNIVIFLMIGVEIDIKIDIID
jgi:hypothetical protein